jgi:hypothetical protein
MALRDLGAFLEDDGLEYPLRAASFEDPSKHPDAKHDDGTYAKKYKVPSPSAKVGLWLTALADIGVKANSGGEVSPADLAAIKLDDDEERTLYQRVLGGAYDEMLADGVKWTVLQRIGQDAYLCFAMSTQVADSALSLGEAPARPNRATRRTAKKTAGSRSPRASTAATGSARAATSRTSGSSTSPTAPEGTAEAV